MTYELLDSGNGLKLERFGGYTLIRPCPQALWQPLNPEIWKGVDALFTREKGWQFYRKVLDSWVVDLGGVKLKVSPTDFGHLGVFPEHVQLWPDLQLRGKRILNLFAYSGAATLAAAKKGAEVCHVDAVKGMVQWARENAQLNCLSDTPIRWIIDDVSKFLKREAKRQSFYDGIILDPPTFGRGSKGEVFKIERDLVALLNLCKDLLSETPLFVILSCHTPGLTPLVLKQLLQQQMQGEVETGEMVLTPQEGHSIPSGCYGICRF